MKSHYESTKPPVWAKGSKYGPLLTDGRSYLCPECGGYGYIYDHRCRCQFCSGIGMIPLDDPRVTGTIPLDDPSVTDETVKPLPTVEVDKNPGVLHRVMTYLVAKCGRNKVAGKQGART